MILKDALAFPHCILYLFKNFVNDFFVFFLHLKKKTVEECPDLWYNTALSKLKRNEVRL